MRLCAGGRIGESGFVIRFRNDQLGGLYSWQKIYFSFHHQDVVDLRADVVRNHWLAKAAGEDAGFFDEMTWGDAILGVMLHQTYAHQRPG